MAIKELVLSAEGLEKLKRELEELKTVKRKEIAEKIDIARGFGDLSENSEYDAAKEEQGKIETRIAELEEQIKHARVLDESEVNAAVITFGSIVTVKVSGQKGNKVYKIVSPAEADPMNGIISDASPVGSALMGHVAGDSVEVNTPNGERIYTVVEVSR